MTMINKQNDNIEIIDYHIEEWSTARILQDHVKQKIREGWQPLGGISVALKRETTYAMTYTQALIKRSEIQKEQ